MSKHKRISAKENKTISIHDGKMSVIYTDTNKHYVYKLDTQSPTREITLFGKAFKGQTVEKDFLNPKQRRILNDILYSKGRYTEDQLKKLPLMRQYYLTDIARKVESTLYNWKKQLLSEQIDNTLLKLFPKSRIIRQFIDSSKEKSVHLDVSRVDIRTLVSEQEIVEFLRLKGLFPKQ